MKTLVIYPGRFHPFHRGHYASYQFLTDRFGADNVYVATSGKQAPVTSPFSFADKRLMMSRLGIPTGKIAQVTNPYRAEEITRDFDPDDTVLVFAISDKDAERISFAPKRDGSPSYLQPWPEGGKGVRPMSEHGYALLTPKATFRVMGADADSASQIRELYVKSNDADRDRIIADLYGEADGNLRNIFDRRLAAGEQVREMMECARTVGITEHQLLWLARARDMEQDVLAETVFVNSAEGPQLAPAVAENMQGAQASLMGAPAGSGASTLNPTPTPMANDADRPRKGVRMGVEFDETEDTGLTTSYRDGVTTRSVTPPGMSQPDPDLVRQKDELSRELRAQGMTGAQIIRDPRYREISRKIRGIEEADAVKPAGTYRPVNMEGYNTSFLERVVTTNKPISGITPAQALAELRLRMQDANPDYQPSAGFAQKYLQGSVKEATVINDPDAGLQIRPAGGMGTYDESSLVSNLARKFASMVDMVKNKNYSGLHYSLYRAGVVENMVRALAELEQFQKQQGRRPIARGREIDITDYLDER